MDQLTRNCIRIIVKYYAIEIPKLDIYRVILLLYRVDSRIR